MKAHKTDDTQTRLALLEQSHAHIAQTLQDIKQDTREFRKEVNDRFDKVDKKFIEVNHRFDKLDNRIYQVMFLLSGSILGYVFAKIFHFI